MGCGGEDILLSTSAQSCIPFSVECKCVEKINIWACIDQAERNTPEGRTPCLVFSRNRSKAYAVIELDSLLNITSNVGSSLPSSRLMAAIREVSRIAEEEAATSSRERERGCQPVLSPARDGEIPL